MPPGPLGISPTTVRLDPGQSRLFAATGGKTPYTFSVVSGAGAIDSTGLYTAAGSAGSVTVEVRDAAAASAQATVTVNPPLVLMPANTTVGGGTTQQFSSSGGEPPYAYSVAQGSGSINASGLYTASVDAGSATIRATDSLGATAQAAITNSPRLSLLPASITLTAGAGQTNDFVAQGGTPPYSYALSGPGALTAQGRYSAGTVGGSSTITVTDLQGTIATATVRSLRIRVNDAVFALVNDGTSWFLGGRFTATNPLSAPGLAILDGVTGNPQLGCDLQAGFLDGVVLSVAVSGNSIYVGGQLTHYRTTPVGNLVKLDATNCMLDTAFGQSGSVVTPYGTVNALLVSGTTLYVAGNFNQYRAAPVNGLIKVDALSGDLDVGFVPQPPVGPGPINAIALSGNALYVGGTSAPNGVPTPYLAKLNATTGAVDGAFGGAGAPDDAVLALAVSGTSLYAGGSFTHLGATRVDLAKLDATTGIVDPVFANATLGYAYVDAILPVGTSLYIGREFPIPNGVPSTLAKVDAATGATDTTFTQATTLDYGVFALAHSAGSLYVGGSFTRYRNTPAFSLAKVDAITGALDTTFTQPTGMNGAVSALAISGSNVIAGGSFSTFRGQPIGRIAKFNIATDQIDPVFSAASGADNPVTSLALIGNSVYAGGSFAYVNGQYAPFLAKIDKNTAVLDAAFTQAAGPSGGLVYALLPMGGALYVGGGFSACAGPTTGSVCKLDPTSGQADPLFSAGGPASGTVYTLAASANALYLGGSFSSYGAQPTVNLAKVDPITGALDAAFTQGSGAAGPNSRVDALYVNSNALYVGGQFDSYKNTPISGIAKVDATTGVLDLPFSSAANLGGNTAHAFVQSGSTLYVGGAFSTYGGIAAQNFAKVNSVSGVADRTFTTSSGVCNSDGAAPQCGGIVFSLSLLGSKVFLGNYAGSLYRGAPAYFFYPVDAVSGALIDP